MYWTRLGNSLLTKIMIFQAPFIREHYLSKKEYPPVDFPLIKIGANMISSYLLALFSAVNQFAVVNILSEFKDPTPARINKVKFS